MRLKSVIIEYLRSKFRPKLLISLSAVLYALCTLLLPVANAATVTLAWNTNAEPDLEGYVVYRNTGSPGPPYSYSDMLPEDELADPLHPEATLTGLQEGNEYYIAITAYDTQGNESNYSNDVCIEVVEGLVRACSESTRIGSSSSSGGGGGGGGCFISTVTGAQSSAEH